MTIADHAFLPFTLSTPYSQQKKAEIYIFLWSHHCVVCIGKRRKIDHTADRRPIHPSHVHMQLYLI
jgi:hypothetical protein